MAKSLNRLSNNNYLDHIGLLMLVRLIHTGYSKLLTALEECKIFMALKISINRLMVTSMELWEDPEQLAKIQRYLIKIKLSIL